MNGRSWIWTRDAIFGFWLPFIGWRMHDLNAIEAWDLDQQAAGRFNILEAQWFGRGFVFGYERVKG